MQNRSVRAALAAALLACAGCPSSVVPPAGGACSADRFCWEAPLPHGNTVYALATTSDGAIFAGGSGGMLLRYANDSWTQIPTGFGEAILRVWARNGGDAWLDTGSGGGLFHFDGESVRLVTTLETAVRMAIGSSDPWIVVDGNLHRVRGEALEPVETPALQFMDVLPISDDEVWAIAASSEALNMGILLHLTGGAWVEVTRGVRSDGFPSTLTRTDDGTIWGNSNDTLSRFDGVMFQRVPPPNGVVAGRSPSDYWVQARAGTYHVVEGSELRSYYGGADSAFAIDSSGMPVRAGEYGVIERFDGSEFADMRTLDTLAGQMLVPATWDRIPPAIWANGERAWGASPTDVWRTRGDGDSSSLERRLEHYDGTAWTEVARDEFLDISGSSSDNVWFATSTGVKRWDGTTLADVDIAGRLPASIWTAGPTDTWLIARAPDRTIPIDFTQWIYRWDGTAWHGSSAGAGSCHDIDGTGPTNVWVVCTHLDDDTTIARFDGTEWTDHLVFPGFAIRASIDVGGDGIVRVLQQDALLERIDGELVARDAGAPTMFLVPGADIWAGPTGVWVHARREPNVLAVRRVSE